MRRKPPLHQAVQKYILSLIPGELEYALPGHIADVAWLEKKIVFEIQCSPLPLFEARRRNEDYAALGFSVVWILHQSLFNRKILSSTELYLRTLPCYYTNIASQGHGMIYDQFDCLKGKWRKLRSSPFPIDISRPLWKKGRFQFQGDCSCQPKEAKQLFEAKAPPSWYDRQLTKLLKNFCK